MVVIVRRKIRVGFTDAKTSFGARPLTLGLLDRFHLWRVLRKARSLRKILSRFEYGGRTHVWVAIRAVDSVSENVRCVLREAPNTIGGE